ncbi:glycoside hydrolase family 43 protein [Viridothelium virens]|uniref:Glycoside hydrolase family 43 protein n=1 Tax=Viridothelium virens TaxID=1048519 RepID=A0A6A6HFG5_VIRVR|nr:glycoside hydrolase family 43 protein [Viridothelium virens]
MLSQTSLVSLAMALALYSQSTVAKPMSPPRKAIDGPIEISGFPDPNILGTKGSGFYAFANEHHIKGKNVSVPVAHSKQVDAGWKLDNGSGLESLPEWAKGPDTVIGSPDVSQLSNGKYVMYFSVARPEPKPEQPQPTVQSLSPMESNAPDKQGKHKEHKQHCVGIAYSNHPAGPYEPTNQPFHCTKGEKEDDLINPKSVIFNNTRHLLYKNNTSADAAKTSRLLLQEVDQNEGKNLVGKPHDLIHPYPQEKTGQNGTKHSDHRTQGHAILQNPQTQGYVLVYVTGEPKKNDFQIDYATSATLTGKFEHQGTIVKTGDYAGVKITSPGGPQFMDGNPTTMLFTSEQQGDKKKHRQLFVAHLKFDGQKVELDS